MTRAHFALIFGITVSALFLWLALRGLDFGALGATLAKTDLRFGVVFLATLAAFCWLKSARWARLLRPVCPTTSFALLSPVIIGYMGTGLMPMQLGEIARAMLAGRQLRSRMAPILASILVERILDIFALLVIVAIIGIAGTGLPSEYRGAGFLFLVVAVSTLIIAWIYGTYTESFITFVRRSTFWLPERLRNFILDQLKAGAIGVRALREPQSLVWLSLMSLAQWGCMCLCIWISLAAVGAPQSPIACLTVLAMTILVMTLPAGPGYVGSLQLAFVVALTPFGVTNDIAVAASIFYLAALWVPLVGTGIVLLHRVGMRLRDLRDPQEATAANDSVR